MKHIYILLSRTGTIPARAIRFFDGGNFSHVSISTEARTDAFYSYARRKINNFLVGGLIRENIHTHVFALYPESGCALFSIDVSDEAYDKICKLIENYWKSYDVCKYSFVSIIPMLLGIKRSLKYKMTCSQFAALLLERSGAVALPKHYSLMRPKNFTDIAGIKLLYNGTIGECHFPAERSTINTKKAQTP